MRRRLELISIAATALLVVLPYFIIGYPRGHDLQFHFTSWIEVAMSWQNHTLWPRWAALANYGYGEPRFIFYPPISILIGAVLVSGTPAQVTAGLFVLGTLVLAGVAMLHLCRAYLRPGNDLLAALLYVVNPYNLILVYMRFALSELLAAAVFPLLLLWTLRVLKQAGRREIAKLAMLYAVILLTSIPAVVIATLCVALICVYTVVIHRSVRGARSVLIALFLGTGLSGFYLVPAWYERHWIHANELFRASFEQFFLVPNAAMLHNKWLLSLNVGFWAELTLGVLAWLTLRNEIHNPLIATAKRLFMTSVVMILPVSWPAWKYLPILHYVQFPFRWLFALNLCVCVLVAAARRSTPLSRQVLAAMAIMFSVLMYAAAWKASWVPEDLACIIHEGAESAYWPSLFCGEGASGCVMSVVSAGR